VDLFRSTVSLQAQTQPMKKILSLLPFHDQENVFLLYFVTKSNRPIALLPQYLIIQSHP
jgi:hypothetical protein